MGNLFCRPRGLGSELRGYPDSAHAGGENRLCDAVNDEIRVAADGRSEVSVARRGQGEVTLILLAVTCLAQGAQHEMGEDALLRLTRDLERQLLIHARRHGDILRNLILTGLAALARPAISLASVFTPFRLHGHALHRQWAQAKRVAKPSGHTLEFHYAARFRLFVNSIQRRYVEVLQPRGHALVGGKHKLFDQAVGPATFGPNDALHRALGIEFDHRLRQIKVNGPAALALSVQQARQLIHALEFRNQRTELLTGWLVAADDPVHLGVGHSARRADDTGGHLVAANFTLRIDHHDAGKNQAIFLRTQAANIAGKLLREHGDSTIGKIN